jgi:transposase InsO family protein
VAWGQLNNKWIEPEIREEVISYIQKLKQSTQLTIEDMIKMLNINKGKYYCWKRRSGIPNNHNGPIPKQHWLTPQEKQSIIDFAKAYIKGYQYYVHDGYRRIAYMGIDAGKFACSPMSVYRVLKKEGLLAKWNNNKTNSKGKGFVQPLKVHQHWHTDIKYVNYKGSFLFFISIMDGYSRYIVHHELRTSMTEYDVELTVQRALEKYPGVKPRIISDNGSQYISKDFKSYLKEIGLQHVKTSPSHPQSNGKIERFHRSLEDECIRQTGLINMKDAREQIAKYVNHYNNKRLHSSLFYLRPIDFINGDVDRLLEERQNRLDLAVENRIKYWTEKDIAA